MTMFDLVLVLLGSVVGSVLTHIGISMLRRKRYVITTEELVVRHPKVVFEESNYMALVYSSNDVVIKPTPAVRPRPKSKREKALDALAGPK